MPWLKYRTRWAWGKEDYQWRHLVDAGQDLIDYHLSEIEDESSWSEHYRGIDYEILEVAPKQVILNQAHDSEHLMEYHRKLMENLKEELQLHYGVEFK